MWIFNIDGWGCYKHAFDILQLLKGENIYQEFIKTRSLASRDAIEIAARIFSRRG